MLQEDLSQNEHSQRDSSDKKRCGIRFVQMGEEVVAVLPKISMCPVETKELGQLRAGEKESDTAFESGHDAFGNEIHNDSCLGEPGNEGDHRNKQGGPRGERTEACFVTTRHLAKRRPNQQ